MTNLKTPAVGNFFAIDRRTFARACDLGMNAMVAYLVLGCGSDRENRHTDWSINAIETRTGISRSRAHDAVDALSKAKIVRVLQEGTRPRYELPPACEVPGTGAYPRPPLNQEEQAIVERVRLGQRVPRKDRSWAESALRKGWLRRDWGGTYELAPPAPNPEPEWIWSPNALVTGAADETPPVELIRQSQDAMTLRLLVDLYYVQNLRDDGGIGRQFVWLAFDRVKVGEHGEFDVWGFRAGPVCAHWCGPTLCHQRKELPQEQDGQDFFRRVEQLGALGLVEWVPHLFESDLPEAEILHACGMGHSASLEDRLGEAAHDAGLAMLTEGQYKHACG